MMLFFNLSLSKRKEQKRLDLCHQNLASTAATAAMVSEAASSSDRDWASLLPEILTAVAKRLCSLDYANFSAVCTSWASIASPDNGMLRPLPLPLRNHHPFLLLSGDEGERSESCNLFDFFSTNSYHKIGSLPEIRGKWFVGSQFGWLAVTDELSNPSLLNPFTKSQVHLPPITTDPKVIPVYDPDGTISGYNFYGELFSSLQQFRVCIGIRKLVVSSNPSDGDFAAVALPDNKLIFTRPGEGKWNPWIPQHHLVVDVIYRDGKFLALTNFGDVYAVDLTCPSNSLQDSLFAPRIHDGNYCSTQYLVDLDGVLLHIMRDSDALEFDCQGVPTRYGTYKFDIHSLDPETETWVPVTSLGDRSLFIGTCCSMSLQASETSWVKENCIYFTDDSWEIFGASMEMIRDIGVFNLSNGSFETCYPTEARLTWPPPTWITSPLL